MGFGRERSVRPAYVLRLAAGVAAVLIQTSSLLGGSPTPAFAAGEYPVGPDWPVLAGVLLDGAENQRLYEFFQRATADCMAARGFSQYVQYEYQPEANQTVNPLDRERLERYGYHDPSALLDLTANQDALADPSFAKALQGTGATAGCESLAYRFAYDYDDDYRNEYLSRQDQVSSEVGEAVGGFFASTEGSTVHEAWSDCMADRGYNVSSRDELVELYAGRELISPEEIQTRMADYDCDVLHEMTRSQSEWERVRFAQWIDANATVVRETQADKAAYLLAFVRRVDSYNLDPPAWVRPEQTGRRTWLFLSPPPETCHNVKRSRH